MAYGLSNGYVTDDITWPWKVKLVTPIRLERNISNRKRLDQETTFQRTTNRKWHMDYQMDTWPMTSRNPRRCCEAVRSAILATAWLLVVMSPFVAAGNDALAISQKYKHVEVSKLFERSIGSRRQSQETGTTNPLTPTVVIWVQL